MPELNALARAHWVDDFGVTDFAANIRGVRQKTQRDESV